MNDRDLDTLGFFEKHPAALGLYEVLKQKISERFPDTSIQIRTTQINFKSRHLYACVSFLRVLKKKELPDPYLVHTIGLPNALESKRVAGKTEPCPGRWTTHIVLGSVDEIDDELFAWLSDANAFANRK